MSVKPSLINVSATAKFLVEALREIGCKAIVELPNGEILEILEPASVELVDGHGQPKRESFIDSIDVKEKIRGMKAVGDHFLFDISQFSEADAARARTAIAAYAGRLHGIGTVSTRLDRARKVINVIRVAEAQQQVG